MIFNFEWIDNYYRKLPDKMAELSAIINKPLSFTEKILYAHLTEKIKETQKGMDYVQFNPVRGQQDAQRLIGGSLQPEGRRPQRWRIRMRYGLTQE